MTVGRLARATMILALALLPSDAGAQSVDKVYHIGLLFPTDGRSAFDDLLERRLADLGWLKGRNVRFSYRYSKVNDALPHLAKELLQEHVDVIATAGTPASLAAKHATTTTPIVFWSVGDPVGVGLVSSLGRPGGNVTGISGITYQLGAKRLEILKELLPDARLVGILLNRTDPTASQVLDALRRGFQIPNVAIEPFYAGRPAEIDAAFQAMKRRGVNAVVVQPDGMFWTQRPTIVKLTANLRLPAIYAFKEDVEAGGLVSYGASFFEMQAQAVAYIDKILRGVAPSGLPVQEPAKFELAININAARALTLAIPRSLMLRADQVVE